MLAAIIIIISLAIAAGAIALLVKTNKLKNTEANSSHYSPPPLPNRRFAELHQSTSIIPNSVENDTQKQPAPLPSRQTFVTAAVFNENEGLTGESGPRGITIYQYPCCPYDRTKNREGSTQVVFWNKSGNYYQCIHGHKFKMNGKPLIQ